MARPRRGTNMWVWGDDSKILPLPAKAINLSTEQTVDWPVKLDTHFSDGVTVMLRILLCHKFTSYNNTSLI